jgi:hypothetical protein
MAEIRAMSEIRAITLHLQFVTVCVVNATNWWKFEGFLTYALSALTNFSRMCSILLQFATACAVYAYYFILYVQCTLIFFAVCAEYVNNLLPYAQSTLKICYRMCRVCLQFATACAGYAYNLLPYVQCTLTKQLIC